MDGWYFFRDDSDEIVKKLRVLFMKRRETGGVGNKYRDGQVDEDFEQHNLTSPPCIVVAAIGRGVFEDPPRALEKRRPTLRQARKLP